MQLINEIGTPKKDQATVEHLEVLSSWENS